MTFYTFMIRNYLNSDSASGDLARDMKADKESFPRNGKGKYEGWHTLLLDYLHSRSACRECICAFEESWKEYVECEKKQLNRNLYRQ